MTIWRQRLQLAFLASLAGHAVFYGALFLLSLASGDVPGPGGPFAAALLKVWQFAAYTAVFTVPTTLIVLTYSAARVPQASGPVSHVLASALLVSVATSLIYFGVNSVYHCWSANDCSLFTGSFLPVAVLIGSLVALPAGVIAALVILLGWKRGCLNLT